MMTFHIFLIALCGCAIICGAMASHRNRAVARWSAAGFAFGVITIVILAAVGRSDDAAVASASSQSPLDELTKLKALKDGGVLSEAEFHQQKQRLLNA